MNYDNRTRSYNGTYRDKRGKKHSFRLKVNPRIVSMILAITLVPTATVAIIHSTKNTDKETIGYEDSYKDPNLELIDEILAKNPNMLVNIVEEDYTIKFGDTLSQIALDNGMTLKELMKLNGITDSKAIIKAGDEIKVNKHEKITGNDAEIIMLESYLHDYILESKIADIAKGKVEGTSSEEQMYYKNILFGNPKTEADVDTNSIYGRFVQAYLNYHEKEVTEESQTKYIKTLTEISDDSEEQINLGGMTSYITSYSDYREYCQNGTTKSAELSGSSYNVYG